MQLVHAATAPENVAVTVRFFTQEERGATPLPVPEAEFSGREKALAFFHAERQLCVGLGPVEKVDARAVSAAAGAAVRWLQKNGRASAAFLFSDTSLAAAPELAQAAAQGAVLGAYRFDRFKQRDDEPLDVGDEPVKTKLATLTIVGGDADAVARGRALGEAANFARELANSPPNHFFPETLAQAAQRLADGSGGALTVEIFDESRLRAESFGGLLAVGSGSARPPRLVVLRYHGAEAAEEKPLLALVGKAMTFDSGGLSIKPAQGMEEMVWDKCGGCAVLGAMHGIAALKPKASVVALIASAENMTGPAAYRPGDIVTVYDGKHIEINNTDAEGRVILADALGYARQTLGAARIIDLATLTGACVVALGEETAGLWSNHDEFEAAVLDASMRADEALWPMPITKEHEKRIESDIALIKNSSGRPGGACTAAAFLKHFVGDTPWAHLDIAGPSAITKDRADLARGATGFGTRTLIELTCGL
ncbi:MAG: leucyl aminopeptidase [Verrucomicrobia bacterium]|nr:leucyl aminopeptidase [Verrucomicrobiota bacterium]